MATPIKIEFVSDISCPWCAIGLFSLEEALKRTADVVDPELSFQPFELNPDLPAGGTNALDHVKQKGISPDQARTMRQAIVARAADLGFTMNFSDDSRIYNTFDAHRLLHWAELEGRQAQLKHALFSAHFTKRQDPGDHAVLVEAAKSAGLDPATAEDILKTDRYADDVRRDEVLWRNRGVNSVPTIVIDGKYAVSGGQPVEVFENILRQAARDGGNVGA